MNTTDGDTARATEANALPVSRRLSTALGIRAGGERRRHASSTRVSRDVSRVCMIIL
jgi:hypothetical protein